MSEFRKPSEFGRNLAFQLFEVTEVEELEEREVGEGWGESSGHVGVEDEVGARHEAGARDVNDSAGGGVAGDPSPGTAVGGGCPCGEEV